MLKSFTIILILSFSIIFSNERGWEHPQTGWQIITTETMCFYLVHSAFSDNIELESDQNDVIGVFFEDQNIGWEFYNNQVTIIPTTGDNGSMPGYPLEGDHITFKIYDASEDIIIDGIALDPVPLWETHGFKLVHTLYSCTSDFPILDNGDCILSCMADPNLDGEINILDIIEMVNLIIECDYPFECFENNIECMDINQDSIIDILDILYILNNILRD